MHALCSLALHTAHMHSPSYLFWSDLFSPRGRAEDRSRRIPRPLFAPNEMNDNEVGIAGKATAIRCPLDCSHLEGTNLWVNDVLMTTMLNVLSIGQASEGVLWLSHVIRLDGGLGEGE